MSKTQVKRLLLLMILAALLLLVGAPSLAAPAEEEYELGWITFGGGGGWMASDDQTYAMSATMGQPGVGDEPMTGGEYSLADGFWAMGQETYTYLPIMMR